MDNNRLTLKQRAFIDNYVVTLNGAEASRRAGYSSVGANGTGSRLLANPIIKEAIEAKTKAIQEQLSIKKENIVKKLYEDAMGAEKPSDRANSATVLGKYMGWTKEATQVNVGLYTQMIENTEVKPETHG